MAWTVSASSKNRAKIGGYLILCLSVGKQDPCQGVCTSPLFLKFFYLTFLSHRRGEVFFNLSFNFIPSYIILNIYNIYITYMCYICSFLYKLMHKTKLKLTIIYQPRGYPPLFFQSFFLFILFFAIIFRKKYEAVIFYNFIVIFFIRSKTMCS